MLYLFDKIELLEDDFFENVSHLLSLERRLKAQRLRLGVGRNASAAAYLVLRVALREEYGVDEAVTFKFSSKGKPTLKDYPLIFFNMSHSKGVAACAVAAYKVGVDVQNIRHVTDRTAKRVLTLEEFDEYKSSKNPNEYFCKVWAIKESYLKMTGQGITSEVKDISAKELENIFSFKNENYYCSVCGSRDKIEKVKYIGREHFEKLRR